MGRDQQLRGGAGEAVERIRPFTAKFGRVFARVTPWEVGMAGSQHSWWVCTGARKELLEWGVSAFHKGSEEDLGVLECGGYGNGRRER